MLAIIRAVPDVLFQCEKREDGKIYWTFNEGRLAQEFHLTTDEVRGKPLNELFPPEVADRLIPEFERAVRGEPREFTNELFGRYFKHYPQPVRDAEGRIVAVVGFISEVTELVKAEQHIRELNDQLARHVDQLAHSNKELESFSYTVSHDLRTPLTVISNHIQLLLARKDTPWSEPDAQSLQKVRTATQRMGQLIGDILRLSRSSTDPLERQSLDLAEMARGVAGELDESDPDRRVAWSIQPTPAVACDARLMRVVLQNLLGNAWKYTAKAQDARIEFGSTPGVVPPVFFVRDNGVGFDLTHADRLFQAFSRLHADDEFPGSGVGLATVRRIVERHGGRVWAQAEPGKGATFYFMIGGAPA
jgi:signal transduction histidine kinase